MFRDLFSLLDEQRERDREEREREKEAERQLEAESEHFERVKRATTMAKLPKWLAEATSTVENFDSNVRTLQRSLTSLSNDLKYFETGGKKVEEKKDTAHADGVALDVLQRVATFCAMRELGRFPAVAKEWRDLPGLDAAWRTACLARWGRQIPAKGAKRAAKAMEASLHDCLAVVAYLNESGHPDEVGGGARRRVLGAFWLLVDLSSQSPRSEAAEQAMRACLAQRIGASLTALLESDVLGTAAAAALGNIIASGFADPKVVTENFSSVRRKLDASDGYVEASRLILLQCREEIKPLFARPNPRDATLEKLRDRLQGVWLGEMLFATSGDTEQRVRCEICVGEDLPNYFADDAEFFRFVEESQSERRRLQGSGNLLLGHVSGRGSDGKHRFSLYGMVFKKDPDVVTLRQQFSSRSMEWALRLPAGSDDECVLCGVWICGKRHPMYLRRPNGDEPDFPPPFDDLDAAE